MTNEMKGFLEAFNNACHAMRVLSEFVGMLEGHEYDIVDNLSGWQNTFSESLEEVPFSMLATYEELKEKLERYN